MKVGIDKIKCETHGRNNQDVKDLTEKLLAFGQLVPLTVEGPTKDGEYYLIKGFRRYYAMKENKHRFPVVKCDVIRAETSFEEREALRVMLVSSVKKATGLDLQRHYENIEELENRDDYIPSGKQKRMQKGLNVPQEIRIKYEKKRRRDRKSVV